MSFNARGLAAADVAKSRDSNAVYLPCKKCDREVCANSVLARSYAECESQDRLQPLCVTLQLMLGCWNLAQIRPETIGQVCFSLANPMATSDIRRSNSDAGSPFASENGDLAEEYKPAVATTPRPKPKGRPPKTKGAPRTSCSLSVGLTVSSR